MSSQTHHLHFLLVPLMSQSHLIPFTQLAKLLASQGITVTIVLTPLNASRFNHLIDEAKASNLKIHFQVLTFPCAQVGLPQGCENMDSLTSPEHQPLFFAASNMLKEPLENWLSALETLPNCIVCDICLPWTSYVASKFKITRVVFHGISCFALLCSHNISQSKVHEGVNSISEPFLVPDLPDKIEFTLAQLPQAMKQYSRVWKDTFDQFKKAESSAQGVLVNTFEELEKMYVKGYEEVAKTIWCVGPLSLFERGDGCSRIESECLNFLNCHKPCSVIYVCFGSMSRLVASQLKELALGLEASKHPFIWVIGKNDGSKEVEEWLEEEKFAERNKGRGFIIKGWAAQVQILSHLATGGFLTHCGWNSTLEGVCAGIPTITWPMFAEQFYNEKMIVEVLKTGVRIGIEVGVDPLEREKDEKLLVKREDVKKAIEQIMDKGTEGEQRRNRARELKELAHKAIGEGGSSTLNFKLFIQEIVGQVHN